MLKQLHTFWAEHPAIDAFFGLGTLSLLWLFHNVQFFTTSGLIAITNALVTSAGLAMAAATFVATILYQSANPTLRQAILKHHKTTARNWLHIIGINLIACVAASFMVGFADTYQIQVERFMLATFTTVFITALRALWWLWQFFRMDYVDSINTPVNI